MAKQSTIGSAATNNRIIKDKNPDNPVFVPGTDSGETSIIGYVQRTGGDLSVAQDYENYLNNREAINALIAANPGFGFYRGLDCNFC